MLIVIIFSQLFYPNSFYYTHVGRAIFVGMHLVAMAMPFICLKWTRFDIVSTPWFVMIAARIFHMESQKHIYDKTVENICNASIATSAPGYMKIGKVYMQEEKVQSYCNNF